MTAGRTIEINARFENAYLECGDSEEEILDEYRPILKKNRQFAELLCENVRDKSKDAFFREFCVELLFNAEEHRDLLYDLMLSIFDGRLQDDSHRLISAALCCVTSALTEQQLKELHPLVTRMSEHESPAVASTARAVLHLIYRTPTAR